ncbi:ATP-binding domain-containing protein [Candidatus Saccharibacteria bacterium]|nr:ATP-binding domain-containing protein [Candidatus Saccharibacteria bacterium]
MLSVAKQYQDQGLEDFLEEVALVSENESSDTEDKSKGSITLMTLHSAKGLEFKTVFMVGLEETILPHSRAHYDQKDMEEERRLCYVGMTRAREVLYLLHASSRILYGGVQHNPPSRFLSEMSDSTNLVSSAEFSMGEYNLTPQQQKNSDEPRYVPELSEGDEVSHQIFGKGVVLDLVGDNATIYFKGKGTKKLDISFAPIEKLG